MVSNLGDQKVTNGRSWRYELYKPVLKKYLQAKSNSQIFLPKHNHTCTNKKTTYTNEKRGVVCSCCSLKFVALQNMFLGVNIFVFGIDLQKGIKLICCAKVVEKLSSSQQPVGSFGQWLLARVDHEA